jgi:formylmethanofuran dehydrogenase subunit B
LIGGWATDVAGARSAYRLAARIGAVSDHAHGPALTAALRAQQDRGGYTTTLAEVQNRAELIVCVGTQPSAHYPEFFRRCGVEQPTAAGAPRRIVFLGAPIDQRLSGPSLDSLPLAGDLLDTLAQLEALLAGRPLREAPAHLQALAEQLRQSPYSVLVWEAAALPAHGALVVEALNRLVGVLNQSTRAATLGLGGSDGGYTAQQVHTWLSGLPLRTRIGSQGLDHDPLRHDTDRLLARHEADALVWIASFGPHLSVPPTGVPSIVLGHPGLPVPGGEVIYIPVATPGIGAAGHVLRSDGSVVLPLHAVFDQGLPSVAEVLNRLLQTLETHA